MPKGLLGSDRDKMRAGWAGHVPYVAKLEIHMTVVGKSHTWKDIIKVSPHTVVCECGMSSDNSG